jgi:DNA-binding NarL/FixJ family response regulator
VNVVLFVNDLMDRSKLSGVFDGARFGRQPSDADGAELVIVDLTRFGESVAEIRAAAPDARIVGYGPHVDTEAADAAITAGADAALPRSRFFRDPGATAAP